MVIFFGNPWVRIALVKKAAAAAQSRVGVNKKSTVRPSYPPRDISVHCPLTHVSLIHQQACPHRLVPTTELLLKLRAIFDDPAVERGVIDPEAPLFRHLFELPVGIGYATYHSRNDCL